MGRPTVRGAKQPSGRRVTRLKRVSRRVEAILAGEAKYDDRNARSFAQQVRRWANEWGACYQVAFNLVCLGRYDPVLRGSKLIHGIVDHSSGGPMVHAWVEVGSVCVDLTKPLDSGVRYCWRDSFHHEFVVDRRAYSLQQAVKNLERENTTGPWEPCFAALQDWCEAVWTKAYRRDRTSPAAQNGPRPRPLTRVQRQAERRRARETLRGAQ